MAVRRKPPCNNERPHIVQEALKNAPKHPGMHCMPREIEEQNKLADALLEWAKLETSFPIEEFAISIGINPYRFKKAREKNIYFKDVYESAEILCSRRLMKMGLTRKYDSNLTKEILPLYHEEYREYRSEMVTRAIEARLKAAEVEKAKGDIHIHMEPFPSSELVPNKKEEE